MNQCDTTCQLCRSKGFTLQIEDFVIEICRLSTWHTVLQEVFIFTQGIDTLTTLSDG